MSTSTRPRSTVTLDESLALRRDEPHDLDQAYFWTEEWQRAEREASADIKAGRYKLFRSAKALIADLRG